MRVALAIQRGWRLAGDGDISNGAEETTRLADEIALTWTAGIRSLAPASLGPVAGFLRDWPLGRLVAGMTGGRECQRTHILYSQPFKLSGLARLWSTSIPNRLQRVRQMFVIHEAPTRIHPPRSRHPNIELLPLRVRGNPKENPRNGRVPLKFWDRLRALRRAY